jgi:CHAT domain-containing protein
LLHNGREYLGHRHPIVRRIRNTSLAAKRRQPEDRLPGLLTRLKRDGDALRILLIAADTWSDDRSLQSIPEVDKEIDDVATAVAEWGRSERAPRVELTVLRSWETAFADVARMLKQQWDVIHYAGHAVFDSHATYNSGLILWREKCHSSGHWKQVREAPASSRPPRGGVQCLTSEQFARFLASCPPALVYLSCCHSARAGGYHDLVRSNTLGLVDAVVQEGVPVVVGHHWPVLDNDDTRLFVREFYEGLLRQRLPEQSLFRARQATKTDVRVWASAVMVVQATDGL